MKKMGLKKNENGITMTVLVVTIILMLILAGVSIGIIKSNSKLEDVARDTINETKQSMETKVTAIDDLTKKIDAKREGNIQLSKDIVEWTNNNVKVSAKMMPADNNLKIQLSNDNKNWNDTESIDATNYGEIIYARLVNKQSNEIISNSNITITNIDKQAPTDDAPISLRATTNKIEVDNKQQDFGSGIDQQTSSSGIKEVKYRLASDSEGKESLSGYDWQESKIFESLNNDRTYYIQTAETDNAGNTTISKVLVIKTEEIPAGEKAITFNQSTTDWTNSDKVISITSANSEFSLEISRDGTKWTKVDGTTTKETISNYGDKIYARLNDGVSAGKEVVYTEEKIDKELPTTTAPTVKQTTDSLTVTSNQKDTLSGIVKTQYQIKESNSSTWGNLQDENEFKGLKQNTKYDVRTVATDKTGNSSLSEITTVTTGSVPNGATEGIITLTANKTTWTNTDVIVTAKTSTSGFTMQMSTDGGATFKDATSVTMTANGTVVARLRDASNNYGGIATKSITIIDKQIPTIPSYKAYYDDKTTYTSGTWTNKYVQTDITSTDEGSGINRIELSYDNTNWTKFEFNQSGGLIKNGTSYTGTESWSLRDRNDTAFFRAIDNAGNISEVFKSFNIRYDITVPPTTAPTLASSTTNSVTVKNNQVDALSGNKTVQYQIKKNANSTWGNLQTSATFGNLVQNTKYDVRTYVTDNAGNSSYSAILTVTTGEVPSGSTAGVITLTVEPSTWTNGDVVVKASTTTSGYIMQMSTDNGKTFTDTTEVTLTVNGTVIARLRDASNNYGGIASKNITIIDKNGPTGNNAEIKNVTSSGYDVYVYNVTDNGGSGVDRVQFPTWTELNSQDDIQSTWATNAKAKGTLQADGTTWVYHVNIADHNNENGKYNSHIYAYDKLGNSKQLAALSTTVPAVAITWNANGGTSVEGWNKQAGSQLGTLPTSSRTGYTFAGWFTAASGGTQISTTTTVPSSNIIYYAHWNTTGYSISYNLNGGAVSDNPTSYNIETNTITLKNPTKTGYTFTGWTGSNGTTAQTEVTIPKNSTGNKSFTANWNINQYSVTCEDYFVDDSNALKVKLGTQTAKSYNYGTSVSGANWGSDTTKSTYYGNYAYTGASTVTVGTSGATVYRYFKLWTNINVLSPTGSEDYASAKFNISYNSGSTFEKDATNEKSYYLGYGTKIIIKDITPLKDYYELDSVTGATYDETNKYYVLELKTPTSITLKTKLKNYSQDLNYIVDGTWYYCGYNGTRIKIGLKMNGVDKGYVADFGQSVPYGTPYEIYGVQLDGTTLEGYTKKSTVGTGNALNLTFYTLAINVNNATYGSTSTSSLIAWPDETWSTEGNKITISDGRTATASTKAVTGYTTSFIGWTTTSGTFNKAQTTTANFSATPISYNVAFNGNGSTSGTMAAQKFTYNTAANLTANAFAKTGYDFQGWATSSTGNVAYSNSASVKNLSATNGATVTLYAIWKDVYAPTTDKPTAVSSTNAITVTNQQKDTGSGIDTVQYQIKKTSDTAWGTLQTSATFGGLTQNTSYDVRTYAIDKVGNASYSAITTITTKTMPSGSTSGIITWTTNPTSYTTGSVVITAATNQSGYTIQTSTDGTTYKDGASVTLTANGTVYARLRDASNNYGAAASKSINLIDKTAPTLNASIANITASGYDVIITNVSDIQSGINRIQCPTWTESNGQDDIDGSWSSSTKSQATKQSDGTYKFRVNISDHNNENGKYITHVYAYDNLGNNANRAGLTATVPAVAITWNANGGSAVTAWSKQVGTQLGTLPTTTRTGYTFAGWFTAASGGTQISTTSTVPTGNVTYYAHWNINSYSVTCEDYFVDASNGRKVKLGTQAAKSYNYGTSVSGTAWGTDATRSAYYSNYVYKGASSVTLGAGNATVYRYFWAWTDLNIYYAGSTTQGAAKVSFSVDKTNWVDVNNESNTVQPYGTTYYVKNIRPVNDTEELDKVTNLTWDSTNGYYYYTPTAAGTAMNIYMKYKNYSISYNLNGGSVSSNPTSYNVSTADFTLNNPTRTGYTFTGWTGSNGTTASTSVKITKGSTGNKSYTANWSVNSYTVKRNAYKRVNDSWAQFDTKSESLAYGTSYDVTTRMPTAPTGYHYNNSNGTMNWSTDGYKTASDTNPFTVTSNTEVHVHTYPNTYTIAFNGNGATNGSTASMSASYDIASNLTANGFAKTGYTFQGWATSATGGAVYANSASVSNLTATNGATVTLYAVWKDVTAPTNTAPTVNSYTSDSITVINKQTDNGSGINTIQYQIKKTSDTTWDALQTSATLATLNQNTSYDIRTYAVDKSGNASYSNVITIKTKTIPTPTLTQSRTGYSSSSITVTATTTESNYTMQMSVGSTNNFSDKSSVTLSEENYVYARLRDNSGNYSEVAKIYVKGILSSKYNKIYMCRQVDYHPTNDPYGRYQFLYYDQEGEFGTPKTVYLTRSYAEIRNGSADSGEQYCMPKKSTNSVAFNRMLQLNPKYKQFVGNTSLSALNDNARYATYLCDTSNFTKYYDSSKANFVVGGPSYELITKVASCTTRKNVESNPVENYEGVIGYDEPGINDQMPRNDILLNILIFSPLHLYCGYQCIPSPSSRDESELIILQPEEYRITSRDAEDYDDDRGYLIRPVVALKENVIINFEEEE